MRPKVVSRRRTRWAGAVFGGLAAASLLVAPAAAADSSATADSSPLAAKKLSISQQVQVQNQWCWAASGLTIAHYLGKGTNLNQNAFCNLSRGYPQNGQCPNQAGYLSWVQRGYQAIGLSPGTVGGALSFSAVQAEIDGNRPIETGIYWTAGGGHAQVIHGYDATTNMVYYGDPWPSSARYSSMTHSSYRSNGQFRWAEALYRIGA
ncbi:papain-like cysteine protease family protein [Amycolatopsis anabasis]|uniref:papain-like cysteine protease family protein n=1 Tax=Amycolatopsis anabasis TaxID=1840409 RepID=UPI00131ECCB6|nr:papain-like cysteine protease family protein [Amycolatopsis anabasis]